MVDMRDVSWVLLKALNTAALMVELMDFLMVGM